MSLTIASTAQHWGYWERTTRHIAHGKSRGRGSVYAGAAARAQGKGSTAEDGAAWGWSPLEIARSREIDLVFWNDRNARGGLSFLPNVLLFECKNWAAPVDSVSVNHFITKVRTRHVEYGFLIASNGITGSAVDLTAAHQLLQNALIADEIKIIVFNRKEICELKNTKELIEMVQDKITESILRAI